MATFMKSINFNNSNLLKTGDQSASVASSSEDGNKPQVLSSSNESVSVTLKFGLTSGDTRSITMNNPKADLDDDTVKAAMEKILENKEAFEDAPIKSLSASGRITTTTSYDI